MNLAFDYSCLFVVPCRFRAVEYATVLKLPFFVSAVMVGRDGEQAYEIAVAECRCPA